MAHRLGYKYDPHSSTDNNSPAITTYQLKVIQKNRTRTGCTKLRLELIAPTDVYKHPNITAENFVIPTLWMQLCLYTEQFENGTTQDFKVLQQINPALVGSTAALRQESSLCLDEQEQFSSTTDPGLSDFRWMGVISEPFMSGSQEYSVASEPFMSESQATSQASEPILDANLVSYANTFLLGSNAFPTAAPAIVPQPEGITYTLKYIKGHFPILHGAIRDARILAKDHITTHGQYVNNVQELCHGFLVETITFARNAGRPVESGLRCSETLRTIRLKTVDVHKVDEKNELVDYVSDAQKILERSMKELTTEWVYSKKRADCGGYDMLSKTEDDARAFITRNTNMTTSESEVTTIKFTCAKEDDGKPYRRVVVRALLANRIVRSMNDCGRSLLNCFPDHYNALPEEFIAEICAHIVILLRRFLPGGNRGDYTWPREDIIQREQWHQLNLLRNFRAQSGSDAVEFNRWMTTREGDEGWFVDLDKALTATNKLRGPTPSVPT
ncbi:hypothetical protein M405DRAFT_880198 [Rhizopogon salebrosus TDB-379]|nr:hypothetical protein M405DRAFT_880198 [Rhizopogon salebrosus TDB-379]